MKNIRLLSIILIFSMVFSMSFASAADDSRSEVSSRAFTEGEREGHRTVRTMYIRELEIPITPDIPDDDEIDRLYRDLLAGETESYKRQFYEDFKKGYEKGYKDERAIYFPEDSKTPSDTKVKYAKSMGQSLGEMYGYMDFFNNIRSNWSKAIPSNSKITSLFNLNKETAQYRTNFLSEFKEAFKTAYEEAFELGLMNSKSNLIGSSVEDGRTIGEIIGAIYGEKDYFDNKSNDYKRDLPSDSTISRDYLLNNRLVEYKTGFINGFKIGYEEAYNQAFYNSFKVALEDGKKAGAIKGEIMAKKDFVLGNKMNWDSHKSTISSVYTEYKLIYLSNVYRETFINGFWIGFNESYEKAYRNLVQGKLNEKNADAVISIAGGVLGGIDGSISIEIESGTFYNDTVLSIEKIFQDKYPINESRYIKASDIYNIQIANPSNNIDNSKDITISMEYYGKDNGGIYKWVNNKWNYIDSKNGNGLITVKVKPSTLDNENNLYCILVDRQYDILTDIRSHWAKDEINILVRRNIINGYADKTFRPERSISRAEFLSLLSRTYNWNLPQNTDNIYSFADYESFKSFDKVISYGLKAGYIQGYSDNAFRPNHPISYKEIEIIMGRVLDDPNFKWYNTSAKMLYERQVVSNSYKNMENKITRSEVAYMLYILNEWRY